MYETNQHDFLFQNRDLPSEESVDSLVAMLCKQGFDVRVLRTTETTRIMLDWNKAEVNRRGKIFT